MALAREAERDVRCLSILLLQFGDLLVMRIHDRELEDIPMEGLTALSAQCATLERNLLAEFTRLEPEAARTALATLKLSRRAS